MYLRQTPHFYTSRANTRTYGVIHVSFFIRTTHVILSTGTYHTIVWSRCNDHTTYIQSDRDFAHPRLQNRGPISVSKSRSIHTITYKIVDLHNIVCKDRDFARTAILQPTHVQLYYVVYMCTILVHRITIRVRLYRSKLSRILFDGVHSLVSSMGCGFSPVSLWAVPRVVRRMRFAASAFFRAETARGD